MPMIQVPSNVSLVVDIPAGLKRSVEGAIYLRPGVKTITADEWASIQKQYPGVAGRCHVVMYAPGVEFDSAKSKLGKRKAKAEAKVLTPTGPKSKMTTRQKREAGLPKDPKKTMAKAPPEKKKDKDKPKSS